VNPGAWAAATRPASPTNTADMPPTFAIVIPTYNEESSIERLLKSIRRQTEANYSIAVVDQSSQDRTAEIAKSYGCTVIDIPRPHFYTPPARSRNLGAQAIEGKILLHLDADMELDSPNFLKKLETLIDPGHRAVVIHESDVASGFWATCKALERRCYRETEMGAARAVTRELFLRVGGYDEDISSGEDFFITRLYERETQVASDQSLSLRHHVGRPTLGSLLRKKFAYGRTSKIYLLKARKIGARSAASIVRSSLRAYLRNWRLLGEQPAHYVCILPLRAMELLAVRLGMCFGPRAGESPNTSSEAE
jgi:glycosyltransferase involved in cell wall biosynthesis